MKKQLLKSALIAIAGIGLYAGSALADSTPSGSWTNLESYLGTYFSLGSYSQVTTEIDFSGTWAYTAIAKESYNENTVDEPESGAAGVGSTTANLTFKTSDLSNWGLWETVDFDVTNLYFEDSDGPYNIALDKFTSTSDPGFKVYLITADTTIDYLDNIVTIKAGTYIVGFNDNSQSSSDGDYDDIIIALTPVPEPATMLLFGTGVVGVAAVARRKKNQ